MANAETQQQFLDMYAGQSAEMQQKMYNAWNAEVRSIIDAYNKQNATNTTDTTNTVTPTTEVPTDRNGWVGGNWRPDQKWALTPETYNYYSNDTQEQQDKIVSNLYDYYQKTPNLFTNYQNFKNNFSYDARSDQQKKTLDDWWFGYDKSRQLNTKSIWDLTTLYGSGQLTDADLNNLRTFYPDKYNQVMNKINAQNDMNQYSEMLYWPEDTLDTSNVFNQLGNQFLNNLLNSSYSSNIDYFEQYQNELNSEEMRGWSDRLTDLDTEIKKIDTDLNTLYKDIEKRYEGTGASTAKIQAVYADEAYDLQIQRNSLALEQQSLATKYNSRLQEAQQNFSMRVQQHQLEMQERNQYMNELWFAMDLINFETNEEADERAFKNWTRQIDYQYWNINSMDETARRKAVDNSVSEILNKYSDIPMQRSKDQMVEDVLKLVDWGMSLWEALTQNIITPIQSKPEYISWYNSKLGVNSPVQYQMDANWNLSLVWWTATVPIWNTWNNYQSIDLGNWYSVKVDWNNPITINGQQYRITQLWWETKTSWIDFAPLKAWTNQEVQAFMGWTVIRSWEDKNSDNWHWNNRYVEVLCDNWYVYRYNHLKDWDGDVYATWQRVEAWDVLGHMGETWKAYGVHLDLAVYDWSRANSMAVSPLNIVDQAKVFFSSVNAQWLGIGSNGATTNNWDWEDVYYAVQQELISKNWSQFMKSDKWIELLDYAKRKAQEWMDWDTIIDNLTRLNTEGAVWRDPANSNAYDAFERVFSKEYNSNQEKSYNFKETVERWIWEWKYEKAFEYIADEWVDMFLENDDKKKVSSVKESLQWLSDIQQLYQDYIDAGWKGWKFTRAKNKIGYDWLWTDTWAAQEIRTKLTMALNMFIKWMSWLTVSDSERKQYKQIFPKLWLSHAAFQWQIDNLISYFENDVNTIYWSALWSSTYQGLQDWYKDNMWEYYSVVNHYASWIYHNQQSNKKIDLPAPKNWTNTSYTNTGVLNSNELDFVLNGYN